MFPRQLQQHVLSQLVLLVCAVAGTRCPLSSAKNHSRRAGADSTCYCNEPLHEIVCRDLDAVPDFATAPTKDYTVVRLQRGRIRHIDAAAFAGLPRLRKIVVDFNPLAEGGLNEAAFRRHSDSKDNDDEMSTLRELSIGAGYLRSLPAGLLTGLGRLRRLSLWGHEVDRIADRFFDPVAETLVELSLWGNRLERIDPRTFAVGGGRGWPALRNIDLDRNRISWLERDSFRATPFVETLRLAGNRISGLSADSLAGLVRLRSLRLDRNGLGFIHGSAFIDLGSLLSLSLGNNALAFLPDGLFEPLGRLIDLRLQNNRLEYVWWGTFRGLRSLRRVNLSGNRLSNLPDDVFRHSTRLFAVSLDDNHFRTLRRCALPRVERTPSSAAPSPTPPSEDRSQWSRTRRQRTLSLLGNSELRCDCRMAWLADQVDNGITDVWGSCDMVLDRPPPSPLDAAFEDVDDSLNQRYPITTVVLRQRFDVCPAHFRRPTNCKT